MKLFYLRFCKYIYARRCLKPLSNELKAVFKRLKPCSNHGIHVLFEQGFYLTHICLVDSSIHINWTNPSPDLKVSGVFFHLYLIFDRNSRQLTVETLIRRRLIWVCTVCLCPKTGRLCLYGLKVLKIGRTLFMRCQSGFKDIYWNILLLW